MTSETRTLYSQLPAIDRLLHDSAFLSLRDRYGHTQVVDLLRRMLDDARDVIRNTQTLPDWYADWAQEAKLRLENAAQSALRPVINLTGTVLHTNLGRALQAQEAIEAVTQAMRAGDAGIRFRWRRAGASRPGAGDAVMPNHRGGGRLYRQ